MRRLPASKKLRKELEELLEGVDSSKFVVSEIMKKGAAIILQELLEQEVGEFLGRDHYERCKGNQTRAGYRNGYEPLRVKTAEGNVEAYLPQLRDTTESFQSKLAVFFRTHSEILQKLAIEMYARGLSTRDIEDALVEATGDQMLSRSSVSKVTEVLYEEFEAFQGRDLSGFEVEYLFLDAIYERLRMQWGVNEAVLCAWAITRGGEKVLLHLALGNRESYEDWLEFLRDMVVRGLGVPITVTSDGAPGLRKAIGAVFTRSLRLRCWVHRMRNFSGKVPGELWPEIKAELIGIREAAGFEQGKALAFGFIERHRERFPSLVKAFEEDMEALLNHLRLPFTHRRYVRTTNLIERSFEEERRRTKVIPGFLTERSALKLVFSVLIRASRRWRRVSFRQTEIAHLDRLRKELGIRQPSEQSRHLSKLSQ
jgi:transposase-like protein